jgi:hypothetical protein
MKLLIFLIILPISILGQVVPDTMQSIITKKINVKDMWTPTKSQTDSALQETIYFLETKGYKLHDTLNWKNNFIQNDTAEPYYINQIPIIISNLSVNKYCVQFKGIYNKKHEKVIMLNFFYLQQDTSRYSHCSCNCSANFGLRIKDKSKEELFMVADGGWAYWGIRYYIKRKKCADYFTGGIF